MTEITDGSATFSIEYQKATFHGMIMSFSGSFSSDGYPIDSATGVVRKDWHICDGTNGTPNLQGRFILGASTTYPVGSTGGNEYTEHQHQLPIGYDEDKNFYIITNAKHQPIFGSDATSGINFNVGPNVFYGTDIDHGRASVAFTSATKLSSMPPYYALSYIMKL